MSNSSVALIDSIARPPSLSIQVTIARLIASGAFESHVRAMRTLYRRRQDALARLIAPALAGQLEIEVLNAGLHLIGWLPEGSDDRRVAESARRRGLLPRPMSDFLVEGSPRPALMLGFSNLAEQQMPEAVAALRQALEESGIRGQTSPEV